MDIRSLIGETTEYDKKEILEERRPKSWLKSVSAFANGIGGRLFFGVTNDDIVTGLSNAKYVSEKISETIKDKMDPIPQFILEIVVVGGRQIVVLQIQPGQETPYYYIGDGNRIAYVRVGNESVPADTANMKRLVLKGTGKTYDSLPTVFIFDDFAFTKLKSVYRMRTGTDFTESDFVSFGLMTETGQLTNAGALLADDSPIRQSRLFCTRWNGLDKAPGLLDAIDDKEFSGSLISLLQNGEEFIKNNTKKRWRKTGDGREELPDYPDQAVLECLVNALIHRDYLESGSEVHIDIFDDRIIIYSPGGMLDGSFVQNLDTDQVPSKRRNPVIADIFARMHYMERRGSGFKKINAEYRRAVNCSEEKQPRFESTAASFFVTLYNLNYMHPAENDQTSKQVIDPAEQSIRSTKQLIESVVSKMSASKKTKNSILLLFTEIGTENPFGRSDVERVIGITSSPAGTLINKMKSSGLIEAVHGYGKGRYVFVRSAPKEN